MRAIVCIPCLAAKPLYSEKNKFQVFWLHCTYFIYVKKWFCMVTEPISLDIMRHNDKHGSNRLRILYQILFLKPEHVFYLKQLPK